MLPNFGFNESNTESVSWKLYRVQLSLAWNLLFNLLSELRNPSRRDGHFRRSEVVCGAALVAGARPVSVVTVMVYAE